MKIRFSKKQFINSSNNNNISKVIVTVAILLVIILVLCIYFYNNKSSLKKTNNNIKAEQIESTNIKYEVYDRVGNVVDIIINLENSNGIQYVRYINENGEENKINFRNKNKAAIDYKVELDKDYYIYVTIDGNEETKVVNINSDYLKFIDHSDEKTLEIIDNSTTLNVVKRYYKIGRNAKWLNYTEPFNYDNISNMDVEDINNKDYNIYCLGRNLYRSGEELIITEKIPVPTYGDFDFFYNGKNISNKSIANYGFSKLSSNGSWNTFDYYDMGLGHGDYSGWYEAKFKFDMTKYLNNLTGNELKVNYAGASGQLDKWRGYIIGTTTVYYTDGTSSSKSTSNIYNSNKQETIIDTQYKNISYILMTIKRL